MATKQETGANDRTHSERAPKLEEVVDRALKAFARRLNKCLPAKITKWDADKKRAELKVLVQRPWFDESDARQVDSLPPIPGVPVVFAGSGGYRDTFPPTDGTAEIDGDTPPATTGVVFFSDRSLDAWLSGSGQEVDPGADKDQVHAMQDAIFLPGLLPFAEAWNVPTDHATSGHDDGVQVHYHKDVVTVADNESGAVKVGLDGDQVDCGTLVISTISSTAITGTYQSPFDLFPVTWALGDSIALTGKLKAGARQLKAK